MKAYLRVFAALRHDLFSTTEEIRNRVTIVAVVPTAEEADHEVERVSHVNANKQLEYFWPSARYHAEGRGAGPSSDHS